MILSRYLKDRKGATILEYGLILAVLSLVIIAAASAFAGELLDLLGLVGTETEAALNEGQGGG